MNTTSTCLAFRDGTAREIPLTQISEALAEPGAFVWLEIAAPDTRQLRMLEEEFDLHELAVEDAISARQRPKLEEYPGSLFIALRTAQWWDGRMHTGETHVFCGANYLAVIRHGAGPGYGRVAERLKARGGRVDTGFALYALLDFVVDEYRPIMEALEERYETLESRLLAEGFGGENLSLLYRLKRELLSLHGIVQPLGDICQELIRLHPELVSKELRAYYRDVHDHAVRLTAAIDRLRSMLGDAMQITLASLSLKQNESVQKLAGWGALLAVPTVVFSLYGMNFHAMPELDWPWAYPLVLGVTAVACLVLYRHLRRRGWI